MSISMRKLGILAAIAMVFLLFATVRPGFEAPTAEADLGSPGGISALPSAAPAVPGIANQAIPAIIGTGQYAIVSVFCDSLGVQVLPLLAGACPDPDGSAVVTGSGSIALEITRLYPAGAPAAAFAATGGAAVTVADNTGADMDGMVGVVTVQVNAAAATLGNTQGVNEILLVTATDETGDVRSVQVVVVDTILAWGPTGQLSTASQEQPAFVSYHCDTLGRSNVWDPAAAPSTPAGLAEATCGDADGRQGLDDMYDGLYGPNCFLGGPGLPYGSTKAPAFDTDLPDVWCGGDTAGLYDDFVTWQTDKGMFSQTPAAVDMSINAANAAVNGVFYPPVLDMDCSEGKNVHTDDVDGLSVWGAWIPLAPFGLLEGGCDADGWRNGVVTAMMVGTGEVGVATITAQQGGGISPPREINITFVGEAALSLFLEVPAAIGVTGGEFTAVLVDQDGRPVGDETVACSVEPAAGALAVMPQTGTTGGVTSEDPGSVTFTLIPTGVSVIMGEELTVTCVMDRNRSISASETISLSSTPDLESVDLVVGCNPVASTWPDGTGAAAVAGAVTPAEAVEAIWSFDAASGAWQGYSPDAPAAVNDLASVDMLDAIFICVSDAAAWDRPVI